MLSRAKASVTAALNVRSGEGRLLSLLLLLFFLKGICDVSMVTTASALFLAEFRSTSLPYIYIASAVVVTMLGLAYSSLATRFSVPALFQITVTFSVATIATFHYALSQPNSKWLVMGLMVWREVIYMLLNVACWAQVALLFNVRQSKRLFPLIAAGDIGSSAIGGAVIPFIVGQIGALQLLWFAEASTALCVVVSFYVGRAAKAVGSESLQEIAADARPISRLLQEKYVALFFGLSVVSFLIYFFVDYNFYDVVNHRYQNAESLAAFFGVFYAVLNGLNVVLNGVSGRVLTRYGIHAGLLALPFCVGAGTVAAIVFSTFGITAAAFWLVISTKLADEMLRGAFLIPTFKVLYQPLPDRERIRVQGVRESIVEPVAIGLSGAVLLALTRSAGFQVPQLLYVLMVLISLFTATAVFLRREYVGVLKKSLPGQTITEKTVVDKTTLGSRYKNIEDLHRDLESSNPEQVIHCFNLIGHMDPIAAKVLLPKILKHVLPEVRLHGLRWIKETKEARATVLIQSLIENEESVAIKQEALKTLAILNEAKIPPA
jgi:hypothetical protein